MTSSTNGIVYRAAWITSILLLGWSSAYGQGGTGSSIRGVVTDASGALVPNALVRLLDQGRGVERTQQTDTAGEYLFHDLLPGTYQVAVENSGFRRFVRSDLDLSTSRNLRIDVGLEVGDVTQAVTVTGATPLIETETATLSVSARNQEMNDLPMTGGAQGGRIPHAQYFMTAGATANVGTVSLNGLPEGENATRLHMDGVRVAESCCQIVPTLEMLDEMRFISHNASAEFKTPSTIQFVSRQGTNEFHGDVWWLYNDRGLQARPANLTEKPIRHFNMFLWSIGGPIKKNKAFFYHGAEIHRYGNLLVVNARIPPFAPVNVPTTRMQTGDYAELIDPNFVSQYLRGTPVTLRDPTTQSPFPNNMIPASRMSQVSTNFINRFWAPPTGPGIVANLFQNAWRKYDRDKYDVRVDYYFSPTHSVFGRYGHTRIVGLQPSEPFKLEDQTNQDFLFPSRSASIADTWTITPNLTNELRYGYSRTRLEFSTPYKDEDVMATAGIQNTQAIPGTPELLFTGAGEFQRLIPHAYFSGPTSASAVTEQISYRVSKHSIKAGFEFARRQSFSVSAINPPSFSFDGQFTGWSFADFQLGIPRSMTRTLASPSIYNFQDEWGIFVSDEFRVSSDVTLTLGMRYDVWPYGVEKFDRIHTFFPQKGVIVVPTEASKSLVVPSFPTSRVPVMTVAEAGFPSANPRALNDSDRNNISPRIGIAWRPFGSKNSVVRAGYGVFMYNALTSPGTSTTGALFSGTQTQTQTLAEIQANGRPLFAFPDPFAGFGSVSQLDPTTLNFTATDGKLRNPTTQEYNLSFERQLGGWGARVSYFGHLETGFQGAINYNAPSPGRIAFAQSRRPIPTVRDLALAANGGFTRVNGLQIEGRRPMARGFTLDAGYTWMKSLTDQRTGGPRTEASFNRTKLASNTLFSFRHQFIARYVWEVPVGRGKTYGSRMHPALDAVIGGWRMTGATVFQSGRYLTPFYNGLDPAGTSPGTASQLPDRIGDGELSGTTRSPSTVPFFDTAAFVCPGGSTINGQANLLTAGCPLSTPENVGRFGNSSPSLIRAPGINIWNIGIRKRFNLPREGMNFEIAAQFSNPWNHPNWEVNPNVNLSSASSVGKIVNVGEEFISPFSYGNRDITLELRINF